ncbi:MAG: sigma-54 dependent transcriptional regulator [Pseudomonadales bacterium]|nr:sigma-54 dependent transcriptional regulator [Pseudomonadales bacterium]
MFPLNILLVEDSESSALAYKSYLSDYNVNISHDMYNAVLALEQHQPDLLILDVQLPDGNGIDLVQQLRDAGAQFPIVVITSDSSVELAVEAIKAGADDFLEKPFSGSRLKTTVSNMLEKARLSELVTTYEATSHREGFEGFIGSSLIMQGVYHMVEAAAPSNATVFITGESGTGKEVLAKAIHDTSPRRNAPFVAINCGAISKELMESEIFGHVKGAFTGANTTRAGAAAKANGGTLFLDELCEMDLELQVKLLRFLQTQVFRPVGSDNEQQVDVRIVCATNKDPAQEVKEGRFREDLFYRLHVISIELPALRERGQDVMQIAEHFLKSYAAEEAKPFESFSADVERLFQKHVWPGNIRELQNVIRQIVVLNDGVEVSPEMLPLQFRNVTIADAPVATEQTNAPIIDMPAQVSDVLPLWKLEQLYIDRVIQLADDNIPKAASLLEVSPSTLYRKQQKRD